MLYLNSRSVALKQGSVNHLGVIIDTDKTNTSNDFPAPAPRQENCKKSWLASGTPIIGLLPAWISLVFTFDDPDVQAPATISSFKFTKSVIINAIVCPFF